MRDTHLAVAAVAPAAIDASIAAAAAALLGQQLGLGLHQVVVRGRDGAALAAVGSVPQLGHIQAGAADLTLRSVRGRCCNRKGPRSATAHGGNGIG